MRLVLIRGLRNNLGPGMLSMSIALGGTITVGHASPPMHRVVKHARLDSRHSLHSLTHIRLKTAPAPVLSSPPPIRIIPISDNHFVMVAPGGIDDGILNEAPRGLEDAMIVPIPASQALANLAIPYRR